MVTLVVLRGIYLGPFILLDTLVINYKFERIGRDVCHVDVGLLADARFSLSQFLLRDHPFLYQGVNLTVNQLFRLRIGHPWKVCHCTLEYP